MIHYYYYAFMCLLSCILLYLCDSDIYVIVIYDMCALYFITIYMSYHLCYAHLPCFRVYTLMQMSFITCTHAYLISFEYIMLAWVIQACLTLLFVLTKAYRIQA